jgi:hypothetical protein
MPSTPANVGRLVIVGVDGVLRATAKLWGDPVAPLKTEVLATAAVRVQVPPARKEIVSPETEQIEVVVERSEVIPLPVVEITAMKLPPAVAAFGRFVIDGVVGVARAIVKLCGTPVAAK